MKRILTLLMISMFLTVPAFAIELVSVRVTGQGATEEAALQDAFRAAARQTFGTFVLSETVTNNSELIENQVLAISKGYIDHYDLLKKSKVEGVFLVDMTVYLSKGKIKQQAAYLGLPDWDLQLNQLSAINHLQEKRQKEVSAFKALFGDPKRFVQQAYSFALTGVETTDVGADYIAGNLTVRVTRNTLFFDQYLQLLKTVSISENNSVLEGLVSSPAEALPVFTRYGKLRYPTPKWDPQVEAGYHRLKEDWEYYGLSLVDAYPVHSSLAPYLPNRLLDVHLRVGNQSSWVGILKNAVVIGKKTGMKPDFRGFYASGYVINRKGTMASGYPPTLQSGAVYTNTHDQTEVITKDSFEFKTPFRVANSQALQALIKKPVILTVDQGPYVNLPNKRFVKDFTYFVIEE